MLAWIGHSNKNWQARGMCQAPISPLAWFLWLGAFLTLTNLQKAFYEVTCFFVVEIV